MPRVPGPISETRDGGLVELRCRVGHVYSPEAYLAAHTETRERTLWSAVVALEEGGEAARTLAKDVSPAFRERLEQEAKDTERAASAIRDLLTSLIRKNSERLI